MAGEFLQDNSKKDEAIAEPGGSLDAENVCGLTGWVAAQVTSIVMAHFYLEEDILILICRLSKS